MASKPVTHVGGGGYSKTTPVVVTGIGPVGNVFAGTLTCRSAFYSVDFILGIYTDRDGRLQVSVIAYDSPNPVSATRVDNQTWTLAVDATTPLGALMYDPATGDFSILGHSDARWLKAELQGSYVLVN